MKSRRNLTRKLMKKAKAISRKNLELKSNSVASLQLEGLESRVLLNASLELIPSADGANVFQEGDKTVIQVLAGSEINLDVNIDPTSPFDSWQLNFASSDLGNNLLQISNWATNNAWTASDGSINSSIADIFVSGSGSAVNSNTSIGSLKVTVPDSAGDFTISADSNTVFSGTEFYSLFINRLEELIETDQEFLDDVEAQALVVAQNFLGNLVNNFTLSNLDIEKFDGVDTDVLEGVNIKKFPYVWDPTSTATHPNGRFLIGQVEDVVETEGANGILIDPSDSNIMYVGGQTNEVYKVDLTTLAIETASLPNDVESFHIAFSPDGQSIITSNQPDSILGIVPLANFGTGVTTLNITNSLDGQPDTMTQIASAPALTAVDSNLLYYTSSNRIGIDPDNPGQDGHFGIFDLSTGEVTELFDSKAHHSVKYDEFTGDIFTFGNRFVRQYAISTDPLNPTLKSELDLQSFLADLPGGTKNLFVDARVAGTVTGLPGGPQSFDTLIPNIDTGQELNVIDQGVPDGFGNFFLATNSGHPVVLSVIDATDNKVENALIYQQDNGKPPLLERYLDDFAPIVDASVIPNTGLSSGGGNVAINEFDEVVVRVVLPGSIAGTVYNDPNSNFFQDFNEGGFANVTLDLYRDTNNSFSIDAGDELIASQTTDANGNYLFDNLFPGSRYIAEVTDTNNILDGLPATEELFGGIFVNPGSDFTGIDFGFEGEDLPPELEVTSSNSEFGLFENGGSGFINVGASPFFDQELPISFTIGGTAEWGVDFNLQVNNTLLPVGTNTVTIPEDFGSASFQFIGISDDLEEGDETITLQLLDGPGYSLSSNSSGVALIEDDDDNDVAVFTNIFNANEDGSSNGQFIFDRIGPTDDPLEVFFDVGGAATNGVDYNNIGNSIIIPAGQSSVSLDIIPIQDDLVEGSFFSSGEEVEITIQPNSSYSLQAFSGSPTVFISDDDFATERVFLEHISPFNDPEFNAIIAEPSNSFGESQSKFTFFRSNDLVQPLDIFFSITGTATWGEDFQLLQKNKVVPVGTEFITVPFFENVNNNGFTFFSKDNFKIKALDDDIAEGLETVMINIEATSYYGNTRGSLRYAIFDADGGAGDLPQVDIVATDGNAAEKDLDPGQFKLTRTGPTDEDLFVSIIPKGTAAQDFGIGTGDYTSKVNGFITSFFVIPQGQSEILIDIDPVDDIGEEGGETIIFEIDQTFDYLVGSGSATIDLADDDVPPKGSIGDTIFLDSNDNGVQDKNEPGIDGISVSLFLDVNGDGLKDNGDQFLSLDVTRDGGKYDFTSLEAGTYLVEVTDTAGPLDGFVNSTNNNPFAITLSSDVDFNDADFGYYDPDNLVFGIVDGQVISKFNFRGTNYSMKGPGHAELSVAPDGTVDLDFFNTTIGTKVKLAPPKGQVGQIGDVVVNGALGSFDARVHDLLGDYTSTGSTLKMAFNNIDADHTIKIGPGDEKAALSLTAKNIFDTSLISEIPLKKVAFETWEEVDGQQNLIQAPWAKSIASRNNLEVDMIFTDGSVKASLGKLSVPNTILNSVIRSAGNIGGIAAGAMVNSNVYGGVDDTLNGMLTSSTQINNTDIGLKSIKLKGIPGGGNAFDNSIIGISNIGKASLGSIGTDNQGVTFGLTGTNIKSVDYVLAGLKVKASKLIDASQSFNETDFNVIVLS